MHITSFNQLKQAQDYVVDGIKSRLGNDLKSNERVSLVLTGGSSVLPFLDALSEMVIDWSRVSVVLSDERWVDTKSDESNEKQLIQKFLGKLTSKPQFVSLKTEHVMPEQALQELKQRLQQLPRCISCCLLSMGEDGHIASLFPHEKKQWLSSSEPVICSYVKGPRVSLGGEVFMAAKKNYILCKKGRDHSLLCVNEFDVGNNSLIVF